MGNACCTDCRNAVGYSALTNGRARSAEPSAVSDIALATASVSRRQIQGDEDEASDDELEVDLLLLDDDGAEDGGTQRRGASKRAAAGSAPASQTRKGHGKVLGGHVLARTDSLDNLMTCPVCIDILYEPVTAPCEHHFCRACLRRLLDYGGEEARCPKCRSLLQMDPDALSIDHDLALTVLANYAEETCAREADAQKEEEEYLKARAERLRREALMESDPLAYMFESEDNRERRRTLRRDLNLLTGMGFGVVRAQKALFVASGNHGEAINWLLQHQHHSGMDIPWPMSRLQEQLAIRNTRRNLVSLVSPAFEQEIVPGRFSVSISTVSTMGSLGNPCWCFVTKGMAALNQPEAVFLLKCLDTETSYPPEVLPMLRRLFRRVCKGMPFENGLCTEFKNANDEHAQDAPDQEHQGGFLGQSANRGILWVRHAGQNLSGVPVRRGAHLFGIMLKGLELDWARRFPARVLIRLAKASLSSFPFPLENDRLRAPLFREGELDKQRHLTKGTLIPDAASLCLTPEQHNARHVIWLALPEDAKESVRQLVQRWPEHKPLPFVTGLYRGADSFPAYSAPQTRAPCVSLPGSECACWNGTFTVLVRDKRRYGSGGVIQEDGFIVNLSSSDHEATMNALVNGTDIDIRGERAGALFFRLRWLERSALVSGFGHVSPDLFPSISLHRMSQEAAMPVHASVSPVYAQNARTLSCPGLSPRIAVIGVAFRGSEEELNEKVDAAELDEFCRRLLLRINTAFESAWLPKSQTACMDPSTATIHCDVLPDRKTKYRISKTWNGPCPQAPSITISSWSDILHPTLAPLVQDKVQLQLTVQID